MNLQILMNDELKLNSHQVKTKASSSIFFSIDDTLLLIFTPSKMAISGLLSQ